MLAFSAHSTIRLLRRLVRVSLISLHVALEAFLQRYSESESLLQFIGWRQTAGAVGVAWDRVQSERILPEYDTLK